MTVGGRSQIRRVLLDPDKTPRQKLAAYAWNKVREDKRRCEMYDHGENREKNLAYWSLLEAEAERLLLSDSDPRDTGEDG